MTPLQALYHNVWDQTFWSYLLTGVLAFLVFFVLIAAKLNSFKFGCLSFVFLVGHVVAGPIHAGINASDAVTNGVAAAKNENKTYIQKLHGFFTDYGEDIVQCSTPKYEVLGALAPIGNGRAATGCYYVRLQEDTEDNYYWHSYFSQERKPWGWLDIYKDQKVYFTDHSIAMKDWEKYKAGIAGLDGPTLFELGKFDFQDPPEWVELKKAVDSNQVVAGSKYDKYFNYILATDSILKDDYSSKLPKYAGNLPTINPIYGVYRYDFIQWGDGVNLTQSQKDEWQKYGSLWGTYAGPTLEGSTTVQFVLASKIADPNDHVKAAKAELMQGKYGKETLPKNQILIECGNSDDNKFTEWCRFQQGMFVNNNDLAAEIANIKHIPFTPQAFFGNIKAFAVRSDSSEVGKRLTINVEYDKGGVMGLVFKLFKRVEMAESSYLDTLITPTEQQMKDIVAGKIQSALTAIGTVYLLIFGALFGSKKK